MTPIPVPLVTLTLLASSYLPVATTQLQTVITQSHGRLVKPFSLKIKHKAPFFSYNRVRHIASWVSTYSIHFSCSIAHTSSFTNRCGIAILRLGSLIISLLNICCQYIIRSISLGIIISRNVITKLLASQRLETYKKTISQHFYLFRFSLGFHRNLIFLNSNMLSDNLEH